MLLNRQDIVALLVNLSAKRWGPEVGGRRSYPGRWWASRTESERRGRGEGSPKWEVQRKGWPASTTPMWTHEESKQRFRDEVSKHPWHHLGSRGVQRTSLARDVVQYPHRELEFERNLESCHTHCSRFVEDHMNEFDHHFILVIDLRNYHFAHSGEVVKWSSQYWF
jgi:hypothetical protein